MDIGLPTTETEVQALIGMVQYYRDIWPMQSHMLAPLKEAASGPKGRNILCNDALESYSKELKLMVSANMLLSYIDLMIPLTVHTYASDKQLSCGISHNNKPILLFSRRLSKPQCN